MNNERTICIQPTLNDVFGDIDIKLLFNSLDVKGICDKLIVKLSLLQILLFFDGQKNYSVQKQIFNLLCYPIQNTDEGKCVIEWVRKYGHPNYLSITTYGILKLYPILFEHYNGKADDIELTEQDIILLLKLLFFCNENKEHEVSSSIIRESITTDDPCMYGKLFWGILLSSTDINEHISVEYESYRLKYFTDYIQNKYPEAKSFVNDFFKEKGYDDLASYVTSFMRTHMQIMSYYHENKKIYPGIKRDRISEKTFNGICADKKNVKSILDIKTHPVYCRDDVYYVLNWNHFLSQIYVGAFMQLKNRINCIHNARQDSGEAIEIMFRDTLKKCFGKTVAKNKLVFDENKKGYPDAIMQIGNNIFIFEHKDALMGENIIESENFDTIKDYIDRTFVGIDSGKAKGISQIINYADTYIKGGYEMIGFPYKENFNIYPILVFTDYHCNLNGVNQYLCYRFDEILKSKNIESRRIKPLTFMGHSFLFNMQYKFASKELRLHKVISMYHRRRIRELKEAVRKDLEPYSQYFSSIDRFVPENHGFYLNTKDGLEVMKELFYQ